MTNYNLLSGKKGLIFGIANNMSLAWGVAKAAYENGAELAYTYQGEAIEKRIMPLAQETNTDILIPCDVTNPESITNVFDVIKSKWGKLDFIVHAIAFSDRNELKGRFLDTTLNNFLQTMNISCYSLTAICKAAEHVLNDNGSVLTLTYYGADKAIHSYNVMGVAKAALQASVRYLAVDFGIRNIRVNAISAGPVKTLAASAIGDFRQMLKLHEDTAPLKRNTTQQDIGSAAAYLLSNLASGVTGEVHYVDCGYNVMGTMGKIDNPA